MFHRMDEHRRAIVMGAWGGGLLIASAVLAGCYQARACESDADCFTGQQCVSGMCKAVPDDRDTDAASADGTARDGGSPDTGREPDTDPPPSDTNESDTGEPDDTSDGRDTRKPPSDTGSPGGDTGGGIMCDDPDGGNPTGNEAPWKQHATGADAQKLRDLAVDSQGNTYIVGEFTEEVTWSGANGTATPCSGRDAGYDDLLFVSKIDAAGNHAWTRCPSANSGTHSGGAIAVGPCDEHVYVAGGFDDSLGFLDNGGNEPSLREDEDGVFVAKFDARNGEAPADWIRTLRTAADTEHRVAMKAPGLAVGAHGVTLGGYFKGKLEEFGEVFGSLQAGTAKNDGFVAEYSHGGAPRWWTRLQGGGFKVGAVAIESADERLVAASYAGNADGGLEGKDRSDDAALYRLKAPGGQIEKAVSLAGAEDQKARDLVVRNSAIYLAGLFDEQVLAPDGGVIEQHESTGSNGFLAKLNEQLEVEWGQAVETYPEPQTEGSCNQPSGDRVRFDGLAVDGNDVYLTSGVHGSFQFQTSSGTEVGCSGSRQTAMFRYDPEDGAYRGHLVSTGTLARSDSSRIAIGLGPASLRIGGYFGQKSGDALTPEIHVAGQTIASGVQHLDSFLFAFPPSTFD